MENALKGDNAESRHYVAGKGQISCDTQAVVLEEIPHEDVAEDGIPQMIYMAVVEEIPQATSDVHFVEVTVRSTKLKAPWPGYRCCRRLFTCPDIARPCFQWPCLFVLMTPGTCYNWTENGWVQPEEETPGLNSGDTENVDGHLVYIAEAQPTKELLMSEGEQPAEATSNHGHETHGHGNSTDKANCNCEWCCDVTEAPADEQNHQQEEEDLIQNGHADSDHHQTSEEETSGIVKIDPEQIVTVLAKCNNCEFTTPSTDEMELHIETTHEDVEPSSFKTFKVVRLSKQTPKNESVKTLNIVPVKESVEPKFKYVTTMLVKCDNCEFTSASPDEMNLHIETFHEEVKLYTFKPVKVVRVVKEPKIIPKNKQDRLIPDSEIVSVQTTVSEKTYEKLWKNPRVCPYPGCDYQNHRIDTLNGHMVKRHGYTRNMKKCTVCDYTTFYSTHLRRHAMNHEPRFKCTFEGCLFACLKNLTFTSHLKAKHGVKGNEKKPHQCGHCSFATSHKHLLYGHLEREHGETWRLKNCDICEFATVFKSQLERHMNIHFHTGDKFFHCSVSGCSFIASKKSSLGKHVAKNHVANRKGTIECRYSGCNFCCFLKETYVAHLIREHDESQHLKVCSQCGFTTPYPKAFKRHLESHGMADKKRFECHYESCNFSTFHWGGLCKHFGARHGDKKYLKNCPHCGFSTVHSDTFNRHVNEHLPHEKQFFLCYACSFKTTHEQGLKDHLRERHGDGLEIKKFDQNASESKQCDQCGFCTSSMSGLRRHMNSHCEFKKCEHCEFTTKSENVLESHNKSKHGQRRKIKKCDVCGFSTNLMTILRQHMKCHSETRRRRKKHENTGLRHCSMCEYSTENRNLLVIHMKNHLPADEKPYQCHYNGCGFGTVDKRSLVRHLSTSHGPTKKTSHWTNYRPRTKKGNSIFSGNCAHCEYSTEKRRLMINHLKIHLPADEKPFQCHYIGCGYGTLWKISLVNHLANNHGPKKSFKRRKRGRKSSSSRKLSGKWKCGKLGCGYKTKRKAYLIAHLVAKHKVTKYLVYCEHCDFSTSFAGGLAKHMTTHFKDDPDPSRFHDDKENTQSNDEEDSDRSEEDTGPYDDTMGNHFLLGGQQDRPSSGTKSNVKRKRSVKYPKRPQKRTSRNMKVTKVKSDDTTMRNNVLGSEEDAASPSPVTESNVNRKRSAMHPESQQSSENVAKDAEEDGHPVFEETREGYSSEFEVFPDMSPITDHHDSEEENEIEIELAKLIEQSSKSVGGENESPDDLPEQRQETDELEQELIKLHELSNSPLSQPTEGQINLTEKQVNAESSASLTEEPGEENQIESSTTPEKEISKRKNETPAQKDHILVNTAQGEGMLTRTSHADATATVQGEEIPVHTVQEDEIADATTQDLETPETEKSITTAQENEKSATTVEANKIPMTTVQQNETPTTTVQEVELPATTVQKNEVLATIVEESEIPTTKAEENENSTTTEQDIETSTTAAREESTQNTTAEKQGKLLATVVRKKAVPTTTVQEVELPATTVQRNAVQATIAQESEITTTTAEENESSTTAAQKEATPITTAEANELPMTSAQQNEIAATTVQEVELPATTVQDNEKSTLTVQGNEKFTTTAQEELMAASTAEEIETTPRATAQDYEIRTTTAQDIKKSTTTAEDNETPKTKTQEDKEMPATTAEENEIPATSAQESKNQATTTQEDEIKTPITQLLKPCSVVLDRLNGDNMQKVNKIYYCTYPDCGYSTKCWDSSKNHLVKIHGEKSQYSKFCPHCDSSYIINFKFQKHVAQCKRRLAMEPKALRKKRFKCLRKGCVYRTTLRSSLIAHAALQHGETTNLIKCSQCKFSTVYESRLKDHMKVHEGKKQVKVQRKLPCTFSGCGFTANSKVPLKHHLAKLHEQTQYLKKCPHCRYSTVDNFKLNRHVKLHDNPAFKPDERKGSEKKFPCTFSGCSYGTDVQKVLKGHLARFHGETKDLKYCPLCEYSTVFNFHLNRHMKVHSKLSPKRKVVVGKKRFIKSYLEGRKLTCSFSGCTFRAKEWSALRNHLAKVHNQNQYLNSCPYCDFKTARNNSMKRHLKIHGEGDAITQTSEINHLETFLAQNSNESTKLVLNLNAAPSNEDNELTESETYQVAETRDEVQIKLANTQNMFAAKNSLSSVNDGESEIDKLATPMNNVKKRVIKSKFGTKTFKCSFTECNFETKRSNLMKYHQAKIHGQANYLNECPHCKYTSVCKDAFKKHLANHANLATAKDSNSATEMNELVEGVQLDLNQPFEIQRELPPVENASDRDSNLGTAEDSMPETVEGSDGVQTDSNQSFESQQPRKCLTKAARKSFESETKRIPNLKKNLRVKCPYCQVTILKRNLKRHVENSHPGNQIPPNFDQAEVNQTFESRNELDVDLNQPSIDTETESNKEFEYVDDDLNQEPNQLLELVKENETKNSLPVQCLYCNFKSKWRQNLKRHVEKIHSYLKETPNIVSETGSPTEANDTFESVNEFDEADQSLEEPIDEAATESTKNNLPNKCPFCEFETNWKKSLKRHIGKMHANFKETPENVENDTESLAKTNQAFELNGDSTTESPVKEVEGQKLKFSTDFLYRNIKRYKYTCTFPQCNFVTKKSDPFKIHLVRVHNQTQYLRSCPHCNFKAVRSYHLQRHLKIHSRAQVSSSATTKIIPVSVDLEILDLTKINESLESTREVDLTEKYNLKSCSVLLTRLQNNSQGTTLACPHSGCNYTTKRRYLLNAHLAVRHSDAEFLINCPLCDFKTGFRHTLQHHIKTHKILQDETPALRSRKRTQEPLLHTPKKTRSHFQKEPLEETVVKTEIDIDDIVIKEEYCSDTEAAILDKESPRTRQATQKEKLIASLRKKRIKKGWPRNRLILCSVKGCRFKTNYRETLQSHMARNHDEKNHLKTCPFCDFTTARSDVLRKHLPIHSNVYQCQVKKCTFTGTKQQLDEHRDSHTEKYLRHCPHCDYTSVGYSKMRRHIAFKHAGPKTCTHCEYSTPYDCNLRRHVKTKHRGKNGGALSKVLPPDCDYSTPYDCNLRRHVKTKHRGKNGGALRKVLPPDVLACKFIDCSFIVDKKWEHLLAAHLVADHGEKPNDNVKEINSSLKPVGEIKIEIIECIVSGCGYSTSRPYLLDAHMMNKHGEKASLKKCSFCKYASVSEFRMQLHLKTHSGSQNEDQPIETNNDFPSSDSKNLKISPGLYSRRFKCTRPGCPFTTGLRRALADHLRKKHAGTENHHQMESDAQLLNNHPRDSKIMPKRRKIGPYSTHHKCKYPGCRFRTRVSRSLNDHLRIKHGEKGKQCPHCDFATFSVWLFNKHVANHVPHNNSSEVLQAQLSPLELKHKAMSFLELVPQRVIETKLPVIQTSPLNQVLEARLPSEDVNHASRKRKNIQSEQLNHSSDSQRVINAKLPSATKRRHESTQVIEESISMEVLQARLPEEKPSTSTKTTNHVSKKVKSKELKSQTKPLLLSQPDEEPYQCDVDGCNFSSKFKKSFDCHFARLHNPKRFLKNCPFCEFSSNSKNPLMETHVESHLKLIATLTDHTYYVNKGASVLKSCAFCNYKTVFEHRLRKHSKTHFAEAETATNLEDLQKNFENALLDHDYIQKPSDSETQDLNAGASLNDRSETNHDNEEKETNCNEPKIKKSGGDSLSKNQELYEPFEIQDLNESSETQDLDEPSKIQALDEIPDESTEIKPSEAHDFDEPSVVQNSDEPSEFDNLDKPSEVCELNEPSEVQNLDEPSEDKPDLGTNQKIDTNEELTQGKLGVAALKKPSDTQKHALGNFRCHYSGCHNGFSNLTSLHGHLAKNHNETKYLKHCQKCDFKTAFLHSLKRHIVIVHSKPKCEVVTGKRIGCKKLKCSCLGCTETPEPPKKRAKGEDKFQTCNVCGFGVRRNHMNKHLATHLPSEEKPYQCYFSGCAYSTAFVTSIQAHLAKIHKVAKYLKKCPQCDFTSHRQGMKRHMLTHLNPEEKPFQCYYIDCEYSTAYKNVFEGHLAVIHSEKKYVKKCSKCEFATFNRKLMSKHVKSHLPPDFQCRHSECEFATADARHYVEHVQVEHEDEHDENCPKCQFVTPVSGDMKEHILTHLSSQKKLYHCQYSGCSYSSTLMEDLNDHLGKIHGEKYIKRCPLCDVSTTTKGLKAHIVTHCNEKQDAMSTYEVGNGLKKCPLCEFSTTIDAMKKHMLTHVPQKRRPCPNSECTYSAINSIDLQEHLGRKHGDDKHLKKCPLCYFSSTVKGLKTHLINHYNRSENNSRDKQVIEQQLGKSFKKCNKCEFAALTTLGLKKHMLKHWLPEGNQCGWCTYSTNDNKDMIEHIETHGKKCDICPHVTFKSSLNRHMLSHLPPGERPFQCHYNGCQYSTNTEGSMMEHLGTKHGETEYMKKCSLCDLLTTKRCFKKHMVRHLKKEGKIVERFLQNDGAKESLQGEDCNAEIVGEAFQNDEECFQGDIVQNAKIVYESLQRGESLSYEIVNDALQGGESLSYEIVDDALQGGESLSYEIVDDAFQGGESLSYEIVDDALQGGESLSYEIVGDERLSYDEIVEESFEGDEIVNESLQNNVPDAKIVVQYLTIPMT